VDLGKFWNTVQTKILNSPRESPSTVVIPRDHVDKNHDKSLDANFKSDLDYFQVVINEMYLTRDRHWLNEIDPVVYVVAEYSYNGAPQVTPFLVGPMLLKDRGVPDNINKGIIFRNTSVVGPHPYRGKGLTLTVILCEAHSANPLKPLLRVVESTAAALGFSPALSPYTKVAEVLMNGFDALLNSGGVTPLVGLRDSYGPQFGTSFRPAYFALIDKPGVATDTLWVRNNQLVKGPNLKDAKEYRDADFVLYSIGCPDENRRDDVSQLPFEALWARAEKEAASPVEDPNFKNAKTMMVTLYQEIVGSPDLTEPQGDELADKYNARLDVVHEKAKKYGAHAPGGDVADPAQERRNRARATALSLIKS
jgi:hypothetical protein